MGKHGGGPGRGVARGPERGGRFTQAQVDAARGRMRARGEAYDAADPGRRARRERLAGTRVLPPHTVAELLGDLLPCEPCEPAAKWWRELERRMDARWGSLWACAVCNWDVHRAARLRRDEWAGLTWQATLAGSALPEKALGLIEAVRAFIHWSICERNPWVEWEGDFDGRSAADVLAAYQRKWGGGTGGA